MIEPVEIDSINDEKLFSICCLASRRDELDAMVASAQKAGFSDSHCEYLFIDNIQENKYDAYEGTNRFLNKATGKYILLVHQDILFEFDTMDRLLARIEEVNRLDPDWAVLGNVGYRAEDINTQYVKISDPFMDNQTKGPFPVKVTSLDENFLVVKNSANLALSNDIGHFHLYATELCLQAQQLGYSAYVIDFHLRHKSGGYVNQSFLETKKRFIKSYEKKLKTKFLRTPCTVMFLSGSAMLNRLCNTKALYSLRKRFDAIRKEG